MPLEDPPRNLLSFFPLAIPGSDDYNVCTDSFSTSCMCVDECQLFCREEDPEDSVPHGHITSLVSQPDAIVCWFVFGEEGVAYCPGNMQVYVRDGSTQTPYRVAGVKR